MKPPRNLARGAAAAAFAVLTALAVCDSTAGAIQRISPHLAANLAINGGAARAAEADRMLVTDAQRKVIADRPAELARQALRSEPLLPNALRSIGYVAGERGDRDRARSLMLASVGQSRREQFALVWLVEDAARQSPATPPRARIRRAARYPPAF